MTDAPDTRRNGIDVAKLTKVWENNHGVGPDIRANLGLATKLEINPIERVNKPVAMPSVRLPSELRLGTESLVQRLATTQKLRIDVEGVILRNVNDLKSSCGSPKTAKFKPPKKVSKVTLPDWLIKWQKLSNEQPPTQNAKKKLTLIIPPKQKEETSFPKSAKNSSKKIANPKAKKSESGQKNIIKVPKR